MQPKVIPDSVNRPFKKQSDQVKIAELRIVCFLMQFNLPFILIDHLIRLIKAIAIDSQIAKRLACGRTKAAYTTSEILKEEAISAMSQTLKENKFSIIIDETTDISTSKCLAVVCRYFDGQLGQVRDRFLTLIELTQFDAVWCFKKNLSRHWCSPIKHYWHSVGKCVCYDGT